MGDRPGRTDHAFHSLPEVLQPVLVVAVGAAAGVALGRATRHRTLASLVGGLGLAVMGSVAWAFQARPVAYMTLLQVQPFSQRIDPLGFNPQRIPDGWLVTAPDAFEPHWRHVIIDQAVAAWHDAYLVGLILLATGLAVRGRRGRAVAVAGLVLAVAAALVQALVAPAASVTIG